ncbi:MAG TPA: glycosyltransferase family A protein, partial [Propionicimonas sp.]
MVIAAYSPGDSITRVIDSLDAQTLPQDQFETVIVDDGSPDDTYNRLLLYAAERPNLRVLRIENSGWPSRPRNVGTAAATGDYVLYMDHDDSLYPDALRRLVGFAAETSADMISPRESKTSDIWWCMPAVAAGNTADVKATGGVNRLLPMVPHKAYRREFLLANGIRFPEGRRMLWEDVHFNVEAYAKADRVAVLADTPVYLWHESTTNNSATYAATDDEYWERLENLLEFIDSTLSAPGLETARQIVMTHQYQRRILQHLGQALQRTDGARAAEIMARGRALSEAFIPVEWDGKLGFLNQLRARLLRADRPDLLRSLHTAFRDIVARSELTRAGWEDGKLAVEFNHFWRHKSGQRVLFDEVDGRVLLRLPAEITHALPREAIDVTDRLSQLKVRSGVRSRAECVTWEYNSSTDVHLEKTADGVVVTSRVAGLLDPLTAASGRPLAPAVWDFTTILRWGGVPRVSPIRTSTPSLPALISGVSAVAYAARSGALSLDLSQGVRSPVVDGLAPGTVRMETDGFTLPLAGVAVTGETSVSVELIPARLRGWRASRAGDPLPARLVGDPAGARIEVRGSLPTGTHRLAFRTPGGTLSSPLVAVRGRQDELTLKSRRKSLISLERLRELVRWGGRAVT